MGEYKIKTYSSDEIDFFIGIDIEEENLYILPVDFSSTYSNSIRISKCLKYKNNFEQMEPNIGNNISGGDDNVESLPDDADGDDVGME